VEVTQNLIAYMVELELDAAEQTITVPRSQLMNPEGLEEPP
jgi:hypothetical protein